MPRPIKKETQYEDALASVYSLMQQDLKPDSKESDELEILSRLIKEYEHEHYSVAKPNPLEAI